jgi:small-conductance mechanosensitive channel
LAIVIDQLEWRLQAQNPVVYLAEFGESSVNYAIDVWIDDANDSRGRPSDLHEAVWIERGRTEVIADYHEVDHEV